MIILIIHENIDSGIASSISLKILTKNFSNNITYVFCDPNQKIPLDDNNIIMENAELLLLNNNIDLILGWSNPISSSFIATKLGKKFNIPTIVRLGDLYEADDEVKSILINSNITIFPNKNLCSVATELFGNSIEHKLHVISSQFEYIAPKQHLEPNKIILLHCGNIYNDRKIDPILYALKNLNIKYLQKIQFKFMGCHKKLDLDMELAEKLNVPCDFTKCFAGIKWNNLNHKSHDEVIEEIAKSNILIHIEYVSEKKCYLAAKLVEYLGANKPIITFTQKGTPNYELAHECGFAYADITSEDHIIQTIIKVIENPNDYIPNKDVIIKYEAKSIAKKWEDMFESIINKSSIIA
jgi:glycosyltransferase involved in cell wall biosynthesis